MRYYPIITKMSREDRFDIRLKMVELAREKGISEAARVYRTTRKTVRKWLKRYEEGAGLEGLKERSRAPKEIPHKMKPEEEARIVELRKMHPSWGARRLKERYGLKASIGAINRVLKQHGLIKKKKKRWRKRKELRALKERLKFFELSQIDTKDLSDIEPYWPLMKRLGLPRYEYTLRELSTGASFYAYADRNNSVYAAIFAWYAIRHLRRYGIKTARIVWQTDNGSEYIGGVKKKINCKSAFEKVLEAYGVEHRRIPPRCTYLQSDVETFHKLIEDELYEIESYENELDFLGKAYAYQIYFNYFRTNRNRGNKSPVMILRERFPDINEGVLNLPPIRLESIFDLWYKEKVKGGYHVPEPPLCLKLFT
jgi:transposase